VTYKIDIDPAVVDQIHALPRNAAVALHEVFALLELVPWNGLPYNDYLPEGSMREMLFGAGSLGKITYLILEDQRRVDVLTVTWLG